MRTYSTVPAQLLAELRAALPTAVISPDGYPRDTAAEIYAFEIQFGTQVHGDAWVLRFRVWPHSGEVRVYGERFFVTRETMIILGILARHYEDVEMERLL